MFEEKAIVIGWSEFQAKVSKSVLMASRHWGKWNKIVRGYANKVIYRFIKEDDTGIRSIMLAIWEVILLLWWTAPHDKSSWLTLHFL